ncbi:hypothetical protein CKS_0072 [Pantoea stewartii subsp. stewartii DC283]|uniref:Uncharacterized protein n=1 Tax=Pantoea stewartii subsp. stewartii DC283 TaxID=660596 RepID=H3R8X6_PANSE|nr:hypothetical protein CKS_0072 [Pantoea stewartii subsp. stewartii DC283]
MIEADETRQQGTVQVALLTLTTVTLKSGSAAAKRAKR